MPFGVFERISLPRVYYNAFLNRKRVHRGARPNTETVHITSTEQIFQATLTVREGSKKLAILLPGRNSMEYGRVRPGELPEPADLLDYASTDLVEKKLLKKGFSVLTIVSPDLGFTDDRTRAEQNVEEMASWAFRKAREVDSTVGITNKLIIATSQGVPIAEKLAGALGQEGEAVTLGLNVPVVAIRRGQGNNVPDVTSDILKINTNSRVLITPATHDEFTKPDDTREHYNTIRSRVNETRVRWRDRSKLAQRLKKQNPDSPIYHGWAGLQNFRDYYQYVREFNKQTRRRSR